MLHVLTEAKKMVPKWVRIMRIQREITPGEIQAGPKAGNLRQIVHKRLKDEGFSCKCIRCREAGLSRKNMPSELLKLNKKNMIPQMEERLSFLLTMKMKQFMDSYA